MDRRKVGFKSYTKILLITHKGYSQKAVLSEWKVLGCSPIRGCWANVEVLAIFLELCKAVLCNLAWQSSVLFSGSQSEVVVTKAQKIIAMKWKSRTEEGGKTNMVDYMLARSKYRQIIREPLSTFVLAPANRYYWTILRLNSNIQSLSTSNSLSFRNLIICHWS
jgi:hypothetical protein